MGRAMKRKLRWVNLAAILVITACGGGGGGSDAGDPVISSQSVDDIPPSIVLLGANPQVIERGSLYTELGATATDNIDGDLTSTIAIDSSGVNTSVSGNYNVTYDVQDSSGNSAQTVVRIVSVADTIAPTLDSIQPIDNPTNISTDTNILATFSEPMAQGTINASSFMLFDNLNSPVSGVVTYDSANRVATFNPNADLAIGITYIARITTDASDLALNPLASNFQWSFTTEAPSVSFSQAGFRSISGGGLDIISVDLDSSSNNDLIITKPSAGAVSVLLGDGTGSFSAETEFTAGVSSRSVTAGLFNADNNLDLAVANKYTTAPNTGPGTISILLGDGGGSFSSAVNYSTTDGAGDIVGDQMDSDNFLDIVTVGNSILGTDALAVHAGDGLGTVGAADTYTSNIYNPDSVATGDFNKDGLRDVVVGGGQTVIYLGSNLNTLNYSSVISIGSYPRSVSVGDLNGDNNEDIVAANNGTNVVSIVFGNGTGSFGGVNSVTVGQYPQTVSIHDFNNDSIADLLVTTGKNAGIGSNSVYVVLGHGNGVFGSPTLIHTVPSISVEPPFATAEDFNNDGKKDIALIDNANHRIYVYLNTTP